MGGDAIQVEVVFLDILPVVSFGWDKSKGAFFEDGIMPVPQGQREHEKLIPITNACQPVFPPSERFAPREIVRKVIPRIPSRTVVFPHRPPGTFTYIRSPKPPGRRWAGILTHSCRLRTRRDTSGGGFVCDCLFRTRMFH